MSNPPLFTTTPMIKGRYAEPEPEVQVALTDGTGVLVPPWIANDWRFHVESEGAIVGLAEWYLSGSEIRNDPQAFTDVPRDGHQWYPDPGPTIRAWLPDGRYVDVPPKITNKWRFHAHSAGAVCSLAEWAVHPDNGHEPTIHKPDTDVREENQMPEAINPEEIPESDRAHLPDGRWIEKQPDEVDAWKDAVKYDSCLMGFAEWSTQWGADPMPEIHGTPEVEPACDHLDMDSDSKVRVSSHINLLEALDSGQPVASTWVCDRSACVFDAMAYVTAIANVGAFWAPKNTAFTADAPTTERIAQARLALPEGAEPLSTEEAEARMDDEGHVSVVIEVSSDDYLEAYASGRLGSDDQSDLVHGLAFSFGIPTDCSTTVIGAQPGVFTVLYETHIGSQLNDDDREG